MSIGKDPGVMHFRISLIKSGIRILGCFGALYFIDTWRWDTSVSILAITFLLAELLGVLEEIIE